MDIKCEEILFLQIDNCLVSNISLSGDKFQKGLEEKIWGNSDRDDLPGHAAVVSITKVGRSSDKYGVPERWCTATLG
jgi:hypothetical protein